MNISAPFIARPVATTLLTLGIASAGALGFSKLPVSPMPQVDYPTITVSAQLPGASPNTVATTVASPLERHLGQIADVREMTSRSTLGQTNITLRFDLNRDINGAARDVQAAINAARIDLPASLGQNPTYHMVNQSDVPILIIALTSNTLSQAQLYHATINLFQQQLSQISGVGQVAIGGATSPAVRAELNPWILFNYGVSLENIRAAIAAANANSPKGTIDDGDHSYQIYTNDQATTASDYRPLIIAYRNGGAVRLSDVGIVNDSVADLRSLGLTNGQPSILILLFKQPNANIIDTIEKVKAKLPKLLAAMQADVNMAIAVDDSTTIATSLHDTEMTLLIAIGLVIVTSFLFLRNFRATIIPGIAVSVSILGTFGAIYLVGYSLNFLSLMALTIATGFVVDDSIVVLENVSRHLEAGMPRMQAVMAGTREVSFTVLAISLSLIVVFIPILLLGNTFGRLLREFTVTLSIAIILSLVMSLTTTPMIYAVFLRSGTARDGLVRRTLFQRALARYEHTLNSVLQHRLVTLLFLLITIGVTVVLSIIMPTGFFPKQDTGRLYGWFEADQSISFQTITKKLRKMMAIVQQDLAVQNVVGFAGAGIGFGGGSNTGSMFIALKPLSQRPSVDQVIARLRVKLARVAADRVYVGVIQDVPGAAQENTSQYQYRLLSDNPNQLLTWTPRLVAVLKRSSVFAAVFSDQNDKGLATNLIIDRNTASRLGITPAQIDETLYDAFGQRTVSIIYGAVDQYPVIMEIDPRYAKSPASLSEIYLAVSGGNPSGTAISNLAAGTVISGGNATSASQAAAASANNNSARKAATNALANYGRGSTPTAAAVSTAKETMIPLTAVSRYEPAIVPLTINHQGSFVVSTISFNLRPRATLGQAMAEINNAISQTHIPASIHGAFTGSARLFQQSFRDELILVAAAIAAVYILLGVLYESYIHPITILSTLPSAAMGALLALLLLHMEFDVIGFIGALLLIGIVKKNAILMIDFAIEAKRSQNLSAYDAIFQACMLRFRPIMITSTVAFLGAMPLAISIGGGSEFRRPLGISIAGGLIISQLLTLYTTPVVYLYMDQLGQWFECQRRRLQRHLFQTSIPD